MVMGFPKPNDVQSAVLAVIVIGPAAFIVIALLHNLWRWHRLQQALASILGCTNSCRMRLAARMRSAPPADTARDRDASISMQRIDLFTFGSQEHAQVWLNSLPSLLSDHARGPRSLRKHQRLWRQAPLKTTRTHSPPLARSPRAFRSSSHRPGP
jgi:hypothetical protein